MFWLAILRWLWHVTFILNLNIDRLIFSCKCVLDIFMEENFLAEHQLVERPTPCVPSPCGSNAICREQNGAGSCSCIENYFGNPYEGCRPECVIDSDCQQNKACLKNQCQDPCPGTCGQNAICSVLNHLATCTCLEGFTGDPFRYCHLLLSERKLDILNCDREWNYNIRLIHRIKFFWQPPKRPQKIRAYPLRAALTVDAGKQMDRPFVHVFLITKDLHRIADLSVFLVRNVCKI